LFRKAFKLTEISKGNPRNPTVGFTVLSHGSADQLRRLCACLNREYDEPWIACHHDFGQAPLDTKNFKKNVRFVEPHIATGWGRFSVVRAQLAALKILYSDPVAPDWFFHLSASDYPIMAGRKVRKILGESDCDGFLDARPIDVGTSPKANVVGDTNPKLSHFDAPANRSIKRRFYMARELWIPILRRDPKWRVGRHTIRYGEIEGVYANMPAFYGDHWFAGNRKTAALLLNPTAQHNALQHHLLGRTQTDETYFQTVLMNEPDMKLCRDNKRFAEWNGGGAHPMFLGEEQLDQMLNSGAFFARKFKQAAPVLDRIDEALILRSSTAPHRSD
jgi:hypothetical protein